MLSTVIAVLLGLLSIKTDITANQRDSAERAIQRQDAVAIGIVVDELQN